MIPKPKTQTRKNKKVNLKSISAKSSKNQLQRPYPFSIPSPGFLLGPFPNPRLSPDPGLEPATCRFLSLSLTLAPRELLSCEGCYGTDDHVALDCAKITLIAEP